MASGTTWTPSLPSTPSARTVPLSADNPDSSSNITLHAALPETHVLSPQAARAHRSHNRDADSRDLWSAVAGRYVWRGPNRGSGKAQGRKNALCPDDSRTGQRAATVSGRHSGRSDFPAEAMGDGRAAASGRKLRGSP